MTVTICESVDGLLPLILIQQSLNFLELPLRIRGLELFRFGLNEEAEGDVASQANNREDETVKQNAVDEADCYQESEYSQDYGNRHKNDFYLIHKTS